jgi:hypothetical protein
MRPHVSPGVREGAAGVWVVACLALPHVPHRGAAGAEKLFEEGCPFYVPVIQRVE